MNRKTLFCDIEFINALDDRGKIDFVNLCDESCIVINVPRDIFMTKVHTDKTIKIIAKKHNDGLCSIKYNEAYSFYINTIKQGEDIHKCCCPIILVKQTQKQRREDNQCCQYGNLYGLVCYDQNNFKEIELLENDEGFAIKKGEQDSWHNRLECAKVKGNAMVIIDPYIIAETTTYEKNLYDILDTLLPEEVAMRYDLTIITHDAKEKWQDRYDKIDSHIKEKKPKLKYNFNILNDVDKKFHDRVILTNYYMIMCGAGFDLFDKDGRANKTTTSSLIHPFFQKHIKWATDNFTNQLEIAKHMKDTVSSYGNNSENRLFNISTLETDVFIKKKNLSES